MGRASFIRGPWEFGTSTMESTDVKRPAWHVPAALSVVGLSLLGVVVLTGSKSSRVADQAREFVGVLSLSSAKTKITKKEKGNYGFQREGYGELPYFNDYSGSIITYSILDDIDAVIEPNANMQFRYYGSSDLTNKYYTVTVVDQSSGDTIGSGAYYPDDSTKDEMVNCNCSPLSNNGSPSGRMTSTSPKTDPSLGFS